MPSIGYTGAPADHGGQNCSACHSGSPVNLSTGSLTVTVSNYVPNVQQIIKIVINDPQAISWGFQMTIREVSDETLSAGTFSSNGTDVQVVCDDGSQFGSAAACTTSTRQFAEHKGAQHTSTGSGSFEFDVPWTPPEQEVGRLHVYVAAVAGNDDGTAAGDHVYTFVTTLANAGGCSFVKEPILLTAVNAGSFQAPFSSNAMISIFGDGFQTSGRTRGAGLGDFVNGAFPTILGCVAVQVTGPGVTQPVMLPLTYVSESQINAQLPEFSGVGPVSLAVILNAGQANQLPPSSVATLNALQPFAPAFFLLGNSNSIAAQIAGTATVVANPSLVPGARPAKPGEAVTLYGTGFGDTSPSVAAGQLAPAGLTPLTNSITVTIGSVTLSPSDVQYGGLSPGSISGLYQFNVKIPQSPTLNGDVPVTISIGGAQTQANATIPVEQ